MPRHIQILEKIISEEIWFLKMLRVEMVVVILHSYSQSILNKMWKEIFDEYFFPQINSYNSNITYTPVINFSS